MLGWAAYPKVASHLSLVHHTVNHSQEFKSADGWHTNNVILQKVTS